MIKKVENKAVVKKESKLVTVKFKDNTLLKWILYKKDESYEVDEQDIKLLDNFIY